MTSSKSKNGSMREKSRSPAPPAARPSTVDRSVKSSTSSSLAKSKSKSYASDGVRDNDIFLLPVSDYQVMGVMTVIAAAVRLFRISQPTSVVFDEVQ
jgi:dolichyl-phosphate-mannose-protein mannosyltransferase